MNISRCCSATTLAAASGALASLMALVMGAGSWTARGAPSGVPASTPPTPITLPEASDDDELEHILRLDGASPGAAEIEDFAWMEGSWRAEALGGVCEETWSSPAGGAMMAMFRVLKGGEPSFYEFCTLREHEGTVAYRVKHFHPDLRGWEEKDSVVEFPLVEVDQEGAWFDGLTILRQGPDRFVQYVAIRQGGKVEEVRFEFTRRQGPAAGRNVEDGP